MHQTSIFNKNGVNVIRPKTLVRKYLKLCFYMVSSGRYSKTVNMISVTGVVY